MPVDATVPFVPATSPGQAPDAESAPEHLDVASLLSARSADALRGGDNYLLLMDFIAESMQLAETVQQGVRQLCWVSTATGAQLDKMLADLDGSRNGLTDAQMRQIIPARWSSLLRKRSIKLLSDVLALLAQGTGTTYAYRTIGAAAYMISLFDIEIVDGEYWHDLLVLAKPAGVGYRTLIVQSSDRAFTFDVGPAFDVGVLAFSAGF